MLQLNPQEPRVYKHILKCRFNDCGHFDQELLLSGAGEVPLLELQNKVHTPASVKVTMVTLLGPALLQANLHWNNI